MCERERERERGAEEVKKTREQCYKHVLSFIFTCRENMTEYCKCLSLCYSFLIIPIEAEVGFKPTTLYYFDIVEHEAKHTWNQCLT